MLIYVHRYRTDYWGRGAQNGHLHFHTQLLNSVQPCFTSKETTFTTTEATSTFTQLSSSAKWLDQCCFTSTDTVRTIRDGEPSTTFTQLLSSEPTFSSVLTIRNGEPRTATSTFTTTVQCGFTSTETLGTIRDGGAQDGHLDFHTALEVWQMNVADSMLLYVHRDHTDY